LKFIKSNIIWNW